MAGIHPWHDIDIGQKYPKLVNMVVEIPKGSNVKYELDKKTGMLMMDRFLYSAVYYPGDYGFIPQTLWDDGDPLDVFVFTNEGIHPMTICQIRVIGVLSMIDDNDSDAKIIGVHAKDPRFFEMKSIKDIPQHHIKELKHFFSTYKQLQGRKTKVFTMRGPQSAYKAIEKSQKMYQKKYGDD